MFWAEWVIKQLLGVAFVDLKYLADFYKECDVHMPKPDAEKDKTLLHNGCLKILIR